MPLGMSLARLMAPYYLIFRGQRAWLAMARIASRKGQEKGKSASNFAGGAKDSRVGRCDIANWTFDTIEPRKHGVCCCTISAHTSDLEPFSGVR